MEGDWIGFGVRLCRVGMKVVGYEKDKFSCCINGIQGINGKTLIDKILRGLISLTSVVAKLASKLLEGLADCLTLRLCYSISISSINRLQNDGNLQLH